MDCDTPNLAEYSPTYVYDQDKLSLQLCVHLFSHIVAAVFFLYPLLFFHTITCGLFFGAKTMWYLQFHVVCANFYYPFWVLLSYEVGWQTWLYCTTGVFLLSIAKSFQVPLHSRGGKIKIGFPNGKSIRKDGLIQLKRETLKKCNGYNYGR